MTPALIPSRSPKTSCCARSSLRERLREAEETLDAIRNGDVDVVWVPDSVSRVYTLETADQTYRLLVEEMQEGALTLTRGGRHSLLQQTPRGAGRERPARASNRRIAGAIHRRGRLAQRT